MKSNSSYAWGTGYADADITPPSNMAVMRCGFESRTRTTGSIAPLRAQALALTDPAGHKALLLTADILAFDPTTVEFVRQSARSSHGVEPAAVLLAASHTHWGPATFLRNCFASGSPNPWYMRFLEETLLDLAARALAQTRPAKLTYGAFQTRIGCNRRLPDQNGVIQWGVFPGGSYDSHTPVLRIQSSPSKTGAQDIVLVGHACHPTSSGQRLARWTPDYPGAMRDQLEQSLGKYARAMFVMGCGADTKVTHNDPATGRPVFSASPARSRAAGRRLARAVLNHLRDAKERMALTGRLTCRSVTGNLSFDKGRSSAATLRAMMSDKNKFYESWWARQMWMYPDHRQSLGYQVQSWRLGDQLTLLALEGEVCSPLGPLARSIAKTPHAMTVAYVNGTQAYIPSRQIRREGGYEGKDSYRGYLLPAPFTMRVESEFKAIVTRSVAALGRSPARGPTEETGADRHR